MRPGPISLENYFITELSVIARESFDPNKELEARIEEFDAKEEVQFIERDKGDPLWQVVLTVSQQPAAESNFPYEFRISLVGVFFCLPEKLSKEEKQELVRVNGSSMLYGIAREVIKANTARGPWDSVVIPTISFYKPKETQSNGEDQADD
jgi:preprotein translocase subunit SecB